MLSVPLYAHFAADPFYNMACDDWLLQRVASHPGAIVLRLYSWQVGTITFGFNQRAETAYAADHLDGTPVIRRITGGRALYHDRSELTYAIALNTENLAVPALAGSVSATSHAISEWLAAFVRASGTDVCFVKRSSTENARPGFFHKAPCFASQARHELMAGARKVVASAQRRIGGCWLQHGSIKLAGIAAHPALDGVPVAEPDRLPPLTATALADYRDLLATLAAERFGLEVVVEDLTEADDRVVRAAAAALEKNPLARRDPIKQSQPTGSL
ncbi:hypothetical protein GF420_04605 [candidate division GN15 bacterium]|nr:hypothetical protein [candidate division GN15 bacterium]